MVQVREEGSLDEEGDEKTKRGRQISKTGGNTANATHLNFRKKKKKNKQQQKKQYSFGTRG